MIIKCNHSLLSVCLLSLSLAQPLYALGSVKTGKNDKASQQLKTNKKEVSKPTLTSISNKRDFNTASAGEIADAINGIGKKRSLAIVAYRDKHGGFKSFEELVNVRGLSKGYIDNWLPQLNEKFYVNKG